MNDIRDYQPNLRLDPLPSPVEQVKSAMIKEGYPVPDIIFDDKIHRFAKYDNKKDDRLWYIAFGGEYPVCIFGNWETPEIKHEVLCLVGHYVDVKIQRDSIEKARAIRDEEKKKLHKETAEKAKSIYDDLICATEDNEYLQKKKVKAHELKIDANGDLVAPVYNLDGEISSLQFIKKDGTKKFLYGGAVKGCFLPLGKVGNKIFICEGYATGATIFEHTGVFTAVCFSAGNMPDVAKDLRAKYPQAEIIVCADNDENGTGEKYAQIVSDSVGAEIIMPEIKGQDINDFYLAGGDVKELLTPKKKPWLIDANEFCKKPEPIKWLIKKWIPANSTIMVHGESGCKKTFVVLDMCLHIASNLEEWHGNRSSFGNVVYLAGEGHHGLKSRITAWKQKYNVYRFSLWVSKTGTSLDKSLEQQAVLSHLRSLPVKPDLIVVDTLHRFLSGDENSSKDAGAMITFCDEMRNTFNSAVLIVHHTGLSSGDRARGSTAWKGALDVEINVSCKDDMLTIKQMKQKDIEEQEDLYLKSSVVDVAGWLDEDGEQVTSIILSKTDAPQKDDNEKEYKYMKIVEHALQGELDNEGYPIFGKDDVVNFLIQSGESESKAKRLIAYKNDKNPLVYLEGKGIIKSLGLNMYKITNPAFLMRYKC